MVFAEDSCATATTNGLGGTAAADPTQWLSLPARSAVPPLHQAYHVAVAIPARQEAERIGACIRALDRSAARVPGAVVRAVVLVNNSRDETACAARSVPLASLQLRVVETTLRWPRAHAGMARSRALELAAGWLEEEAEAGGASVLLTTDADSQVEQDWLAANLAELEAGADAVAGAVTFARGERPSLSLVRDREWHLATLQARLRTLLDPRPHDRWPTHIWAWGASFAVTLAAYRAVGGVPVVPLAEDRALAARLEGNGFAVRRSFLPVVFTSARLRGRAPGGFADLLGKYVRDDNEPCDTALERTATLARRLMWRARLRTRHSAGEALLCPRTVRRLRLGMVARLRMALVLRRPARPFGTAWRIVERHARPLRRKRLRPAELEREIARARRLVSLVEGAGNRGGTARSVPAEGPGDRATPAAVQP